MLVPSLMPKFAKGAVLATALIFAAPALAETTDDEVWSALKKDFFGARDVGDAGAAVALEAPVRADDGALVPITVRLSSSVAGNIKALTLLVDKNPSPLVATFNYGKAAGDGERLISTRIRLEGYSNVRVIAETADGKLLMTTKFVKAAGGCSAAAGKDADEALASLGRTIVKAIPQSGPGSSLHEAQVMIRHPNSSGFQINQLTGYYIPAKFIQKIEVRHGADVIFSMDGGISLSEDPNIRFTFKGPATEALEVRSEDSDGKVFTAKAAGNPS